MEISTTIYNAMLDKYFYNEGNVLYAVLYDNTDTQVGFQTVAFPQASGGGVENSAAVIFTIAAGDTVAKLEIEDETNFVILEEDLEDKTFSTQGTYSINVVNVKLEGDD